MSTMSQLGEFIATIQNNQDVRTAALEERLAALEAKEECGCAETITALEQRLATLESKEECGCAETITALEERLSTLEAKEECGCGSYDELLASYGDRLTALEDQEGTDGAVGIVLPASMAYTKASFIPNSDDEYNRYFEVWVDNPHIGATYTISGTTPDAADITYDGFTEVRWSKLQTANSGDTVTVTEKLGEAVTTLGTITITTAPSDPVISDVFGIAGVKPIQVCSRGSIMLMVESLNPANDIVKTIVQPSSPTMVYAFQNEGYIATLDDGSIELSVDNNGQQNGSDSTFSNSTFIANVKESGYLTVVSYDAWGNRSKPVCTEIEVYKFQIILHRTDDGDNYRYYFATTNCANAGANITFEQQNTDGTWTAIITLEQQAVGATGHHNTKEHGDTCTLPKSIISAGTIRCNVSNGDTGCSTGAIELTEDLTSLVINP